MEFESDDKRMAHLAGKTLARGSRATHVPRPAEGNLNDLQSARAKATASRQFPGPGGRIAREDAAPRPSLAQASAGMPEGERQRVVGKVEQHHRPEAAREREDPAEENAHRKRERDLRERRAE